MVDQRPLIGSGRLPGNGKKRSYVGTKLHEDFPPQSVVVKEPDSRVNKQWQIVTRHWSTITGLMEGLQELGLNGYELVQVVPLDNESKWLVFAQRPIL